MQRLLIRVFGAVLLTALAFNTTSPAHAGQIFGPKKSGKKPDKSNPLSGLDSKQPDKELYDKAMLALKKGHYDVCRLDLQTLLNTYPDSEYQMRAKLGIGDSWFKEGGSAAYTQAESEYKDFITFFPNVPEAAEAQMRVADIYYMQMEKPDRDYTNVQRAEQEYRTMINQFPDSPLIPRAQQHLRDVQEVLAQREYQIGTFYAARENWSASIARLETVADTYPLFSHSDLTLIALGDAYSAEAKTVQKLNIPPGPKEQMIRIYTDQAAAAYNRVVTKYAMASHVEEAKDRLIALGRPVPEPTKEELAESQAQEESRVPVKLSQRAVLLFTKAPSTVAAAHVGQPTMVDPPQTTAPQVTKASVAEFNAAVAGKPVTAPVQSASTDIQNGTAPPRSDQPAPPAQLENVPESGTGVGAEIITPSSNGSATTQQAAPQTAPASPAANGQSAPAAVNPAVPPTAVPDNGGLKAVGPAPDASQLPPVDKPADAPSQVNDVKNAPAQVTTGTTSAAASSSKKGDRGKYDSNDESSSKHKKKKGLDKLNPF
jgi:outer membrane protein assembly factor BamD